MAEQHPLQKSRVLVNGDEHDLAADRSVRDLLAELGLAGKRVAVAVNHEVVPRSSYDRVRLFAGDRIEILEAVGGG
jgi:thiamine biosynthesis protein ThiS